MGTSLHAVNRLPTISPARPSSLQAEPSDEREPITAHTEGLARRTVKRRQGSSRNGTASKSLGSVSGGHRAKYAPKRAPPPCTLIMPLALPRSLPHYASAGMARQQNWSARREIASRSNALSCCAVNARPLVLGTAGAMHGADLPAGCGRPARTGRSHWSWLRRSNHRPGPCPVVIP